MATINRKTLLQKQKLEKAFEMFDADNSGFISLNEIRGLLGQKMGVDKEVWEQLLKEADQNGDGQV
jgi:calcium-dependent protein kinase